MQLRPYQLEDINKIVNKFRNEKINRQLVRWATGLGKTVLFCSLPNYLKGHKRIMILVHTQELAKQTMDKIRSITPHLSVGLEMGVDRACDADVVVASVATLGRAGSDRIKQFNPADFTALVVDEAHHSTASTYTRVIDHFNPKGNKNFLLLGVTATPNRTDGVGLFQVYDEIVADRDIKWGIDNGFLSDLTGQLIKIKSDLDKVQWSGGDFNVEELAKEVNTPENNLGYVKAYEQFGDKRKFLGFATNVQHAKDLAEAFRLRGHKVDAVWGEDDDRILKLSNHKLGKLDGLINNKFLTEGYDDPSIGCILLARPVGSESTYTQIVGRGTRLTDKYDDCIVLDTVGSSTKHSLCTLPNLFGLNKELNLKGRSVTEVVDEIEAKLKNKPAISKAEIPDIDTLDQYVQTVDLMRPEVPPEVLQFSEFKWRKADPTTYTITLASNEHVVVTRNGMGSWTIHGEVCKTELTEYRDTLQEAIQTADTAIRQYGGKSLASMVKTSAKWHKDKPTDKQLALCKKFYIKLPANATKGDVANLLNEKFKQNVSKLKQMAGVK